MSDLTQRLGGAKSSLAFKAPCRVATTANVTLSGFQSIDGVLPTSSEHADLRRVLVKTQDAAEDNGLYVMDTGTWARARDFDSINDIRTGTRLYVYSGTTQSGAYVVSTAIDPLTFEVGVDDIAFVTSASVDTSSTNALTELTAPDPNADFFNFFDTSANAPKKVLPKNIAKYNADGTAALPAIAFEADLDTGMYRIGSNNLGWSVGGAGSGLGLSATSLYPITSDAIALGTSTNMIADLFGASGFVLNLNNGDITFTHSANAFTMAGGVLVLPDSGLQMGASAPFSDSAGVLTLQNVDALDATTESTIEAAIDTLANLTSIQGQAIVMTGPLLAGTIAQYNAALSDADFATLAGAETLTNKALTAPAISGPVITGTADIQQGLSLSGDISPPALAGAVDNYNPTGLSTATILRIDGGAASRNITGLAGGSDGLVKVLINVGASDNLVLKNETTSTAVNRFLFGADVTLTPSQGAILCYDATSTRWRAIGVFTTAGGGSGTVTSLSAGFGMNFNTITSSGSAAANAGFTNAAAGAL